MLGLYEQENDDVNIYLACWIGKENTVKRV